MAQQPRGRPRAQGPPRAGPGRNALTALGGGVLVLAVAGGAWALFGTDSTTKASTTAIGPTVPSGAPATRVIGPVAPGAATQAAPLKPTAIGPVAAAPPAAATTLPKATPTQAVAQVKPPVVAPPAPPAAPTTKAAATSPVTQVVRVPPVTAPQVGGTVARKAYTFKIARGDTLWKLTKQTLSDTGRSTSNEAVASFTTRLYQSNHHVIGSNPNLIVPGQALVWPAGL
jgi:nucleoid-associated protein YgaU